MSLPSPAAPLVEGPAAVTRPPGWLAPTLGATGLFGIWAVLPRALGGSLGPFEQQALGAVGALPVIAWLARRKEAANHDARSASARAGHRRGAWLALASGLCTGLGNLAYYRALTVSDATVVAPLGALYPVVTIALSVTLLRERLGRVQALGAAVALAAIWLFAREGGPAVRLDSGALGWALAPVGLWGVSAVLQKRSIMHISPARSARLYLTTFALFGLALAPLAPQLGRVSGREVVLGLALGLALALGNLSLATAYGRAGKASVVTTVSALYWVVAIPVGLLAFHERIDAGRGLALALALLATLCLTSEGHRHG
jgi:drug/metabolite transporter (DMT)-like permease